MTGNTRNLNIWRTTVRKKNRKEGREEERNGEGGEGGRKREGQKREEHNNKLMWCALFLKFLKYYFNPKHSQGEKKK